MSVPSLEKKSLRELLPASAYHQAKVESLRLKAEGSEAKPLWQPHPENVPQQNAFTSEADIIGYGGQAGGGKTDLAIGLSLTKHKKSVLFRREATQLRDIIARSEDIIGDAGTLNEGLHIWRNLPGGRTLEFGGVKDESDVEKWRGRAHDLKAFDEAPEFTEEQVRFLIAWNRSTDPEQKCQALLCFNPPRNAEGRWILTWFAAWLDPKHPNPAKPGELRWYARIDDKDVECPNGEPFEHNGETIKPRSRTFIRAALKDNPYLANTDYEANLQSLPEPLRSQLLYGDFNAGIKDDDYQVIPTAWVKLAQARWCEDGRPKDSAGHLLALSCLGADIARGGDDREVLAPRYGNWFDRLTTLPGAAVPTGAFAVKPILELLEVAGEARRTGREIEYPDDNLTLPIVESNTVVNVDVIGIGASAYDTARTHGINAVAVNWSEHSDAMDRSGKMQFVNKRAEHWWKMREALDPTNEDYRNNPIALPDDPELLADLTAPRWSAQSNGIKVESKEDIKKRIKRSPDKGDAVVLAQAQVGHAGADWI